MRPAVLGLVLIAMATAAGAAESADERLQAAEALLLAGDHTSAEPMFRAVYKETQSARSAYFVAVICVMTGRTEEGERLLKRALDREPGYGQAWKALGLLYEQESRHSEAAPAFRRLLKLQPGDEQARLLLGKALAEDGKSREAELVLKKLATAEGKASKAVREGRIELGLLYVGKARQLYAESRFEAAVRELEAAKEMLPASPELHEFLGRAYWKTDDPAALEYLRLAAEGKPSEGAWDAYGRALAEFGMLDEAVSFFRSKAEQEPENSSFRILLGAALWDKTDYRAALEQYEIAARLAPSSAEAHFLKGSGHRLLGADLEAKVAFQRSLELDAEFQPSLSALGMLLAAEGRWDDAALLLEKVREGDPTAPSVRLELGRVYRRLGRFDEALQELETAKRLAPGERKVYYLLGGVYGDLNQHSEARKAYSQFALIEEAELKEKTNARPYLSSGVKEAGLSPERSPTREGAHK